MKTSETITSIAPALLQAQKTITFAGKNARNPHFKNTYADLVAVIDAVKEALNNEGIIYMQTPSPSETGILALTTRLIHAESGEFIEDTGTCPLPKSDPQGYGSAITYMRRYSLASICGLYQDDDDGEGAKAKPTDANAMQRFLAEIANCSNIDNLKSTYLNAMALVRNDPLALKSLELAKDRRKKELEPV
jgi:hypothetical protein